MPTDQVRLSTDDATDLTSEQKIEAREAVFSRAQSRFTDAGQTTR